MSFAVSFLYNFFIPMLGFITVIIVYAIIIAKRYQKLSLLSDPDNITKHNFNVIKVMDESDKLWWQLCTSIVFLAYFGSIVFYFGLKVKSNLPDAILIGLLVWVLISFVGYKITKT
jgi:hypothetical protein